jgi:hypothetical protein
MRRHPATHSNVVRRLIRLSSFMAVAVLATAFAASGSVARTSHVTKHRLRVHKTRGLTAHGQLVHPFKLNTNQSQNWSGYNQGAVEQGGKLFDSITGYWTVPKATQHKKNQAEYAADWIGIGGGCVDPNCDVTDSTLIQTGTESDVSSSGKATYSAWYELIPAPSLTISMAVHPGNRMYASIATVASHVDVWKITIKDVTTGSSYSTTVPYTSSQDTAEWIEETPLIIGTNGGFAALPNLTKPRFDHATTNGAPAQLKSSEKMQLVNSSGKVIADPSNPDSDRDGFNVCAWASTCSVPSSSRQTTICDPWRCAPAPRRVHYRSGALVLAAGQRSW